MRELIFSNQFIDAKSLLQPWSWIFLFTNTNWNFYFHSGDFSNSIAWFQERFIRHSKCSNVSHIDNSRCHNNVFKSVEVGKSSNHSILSENAPTIEIDSVTWTPFNICVQIAASMSLGELFKHLEFSSEFPSFYIGSWRIHNDFHSIHNCFDHGVIRNPCFFTNFIPQACIIEINEENSNWHGCLAGKFLDNKGQFEFIDHLFLLPETEPPGFIVIISIGQNGFSPDAHDSSIVQNDSTVVDIAMMDD